MYTGGKLFRIFPGHETQIPKRDEPSHHGPGPDQPVGAIKPNNLTDDNLKVTNSYLTHHWDRRWTIKVHSNKSIVLTLP